MLNLLFPILKNATLASTNIFISNCRIYRLTYFKNSHHNFIIEAHFYYIFISLGFIQRELNTEIMETHVTTCSERGTYHKAADTCQGEKVCVCVQAWVCARVCTLHGSVCAFLQCGSPGYFAAPHFISDTCRAVPLPTSTLPCFP